MPVECVIVPTFDRPELLTVCMKHIRRARPEIEIHVFPDRGMNEEAICEKFGAVHHWTLAHSYHGNSYNLMEALRWAYLGGKYDLVYVVEDDAMVDPTFFDWCGESLTDKPDAFAACAWKYSPDALVSDGPDLLLPWYLSVAAALPRKSLAHIVPHAVPEYYRNMKEYLDRAYPGSFRRGGGHYEQDGLVLRVCEAQQGRCVWPRRPRAIHAGFRGYHMSEQRLKGSLEDQVAVIELALENPSVLNSLMQGGTVPETDRCVDCQKVLLTENVKARVVCVECFHKENPSLPQTSSSCYYLPSNA